MFRRWPFFQRLLSWTKPYAPFERGSREYERYDWNSLLPEEADNRALMTTIMDGTSYYPSRPEMERNLATFAERTKLAVRYGCRWTTTRRDDVGDRRLAGQHRDLAEEVAAAEDVHSSAVGEGRGLALEHDVEARSGQALPQHALVLCEVALFEGVRDALELGARKIREDGQPSQGFSDVVGG